MKKIAVKIVIHGYILISEHTNILLEHSISRIMTVKEASS